MVCMRGWGKLRTTRYKKTKIPTSATYEKLEQKQGLGRKNRILHITSAFNTTKGMGRPLKPPLWPDPWTHPHPHPI